MSEMVTRVAKAMAENAGFRWENCAQPQWESDARAGLEAMRDPTEPMLDAGEAEYKKMGIVDPVVHAWEAMINAALAPDSP